MAPGPVKRRDSALIDAIEAIEAEIFDGAVWRVVREGRDPAQCSASGGRWDDGTFNVLYTSLKDDGAKAEMYFHLLRGQPVFPSKVRYGLHELKVALRRCLKLLDVSALGALGVKVERFGALSYARREAEYPTTREVGEAAHFLEYDGLLVPSARWDCLNAVLFCDSVTVENRQAVKDHGLVDLKAWAKENGV
ncbi:MAG: RES family NAD+ phosphorylase [Rhodovibrionaceae bacterium]